MTTEEKLQKQHDAFVHMLYAHDHVPLPWWGRAWSRLKLWTVIWKYVLRYSTGPR